jgi:hypothetical protein
LRYTRPGKWRGEKKCAGRETRITAGQETGGTEERQSSGQMLSFAKERCKFRSG